MDVVERFIAGKTGDPHLCEDSIVVTDAYAAIVDGATDITGRNYDGMTGGRWAMMACVDAIEELPKNSDAHAAVSEMTRQLARRVDSGLPAAVRPSASVTIYSVTRRQIWQIGDVGFHYPGLPSDVGQPRKLVDQIAASFRAAIFAAEAATRPISLDRADPPAPRSGR